MKTRIPDNLKYTKEHEWALLDGDLVTCGITDHAQCQLGDVVYLELPAVGAQLAAKKAFGVVESVKAVSDLFAPIGGEVVAVNSALIDKPDQINADPYAAAWMIKIRPTNPSDLQNLMDCHSYATFLTEIAKD